MLIPLHFVWGLYTWQYGQLLHIDLYSMQSVTLVKYIVYFLGPFRFISDNSQEDGVSGEVDMQWQ